MFIAAELLQLWEIISWVTSCLKCCHKAPRCSSTVQELSILLSKEMLKVQVKCKIQITTWTCQGAEPELRRISALNTTAQGPCPSILHRTGEFDTAKPSAGQHRGRAELGWQLMLLKALSHNLLSFFFFFPPASPITQSFLSSSLNFYQPFTANCTNPQVFSLIFCRCSEMNLLRQQPRAAQGTLQDHEII